MHFEVVRVAHDSDNILMSNLSTQMVEYWQTMMPSQDVIMSPYMVI